MWGGKALATTPRAGPKPSRLLAGGDRGVSCHGERARGVLVQSRRPNRNGGKTLDAMAKLTLGGDPPLAMIHIKLALGHGVVPHAA